MSRRSHFETSEETADFLRHAEGRRQPYSNPVCNGKAEVTASIALWTIPPLLLSRTYVPSDVNPGARRPTVTMRDSDLRLVETVRRASELR